MNLLNRLLLVSMISALVSEAWADGQNADISLVQPAFSTQGIPGISTPVNNDFGYLRYGVQSYWIRDPLIYLENNIDQGAVVARRLLNQVGMEYDFSNRIGVHAALPVALRPPGQAWATDPMGPWVGEGPYYLGKASYHLGKTS